MTEVTDLCEHHNGIARQIAEAEADVIQATQAQNLAAIGATNDVGRAAQATATEMRADLLGVDGDIRLGISEAEGRLATNIALAAQVSERNGGETRLAQSQSESRLGLAISDGNAETRRDLSDAQMELHSTLEARTAEIRQNQIRDSAAQVLEIERARMATVESGCALARQAAENTAAIQLEAAKNAHVLELAGERNKFDLVKLLAEQAKEHAECCCRLETATHAEGERTRQLIEANRISALQEQLEAARRDNDHHRHNEATRLYVQQFVNQRDGGERRAA